MSKSVLSDPSHPHHIALAKPGEVVDLNDPRPAKLMGLLGEKKVQLTFLAAYEVDTNTRIFITEEKYLG